MAILWRVTAAVAVLLGIITLILGAKAWTASPEGFTGYINDQSAAVYLRSRPEETGRTIAILNPGTEVRVDRSTTQEDVTWYHVKTESGTGWIQEAYISQSKP